MSGGHSQRRLLRVHFIVNPTREVSNMTDKSTSNVNPSRRRFVVSTGGAIGAAALAGVLSRTAQAADLPHVVPTDGPATALAYTEDATTSKNAKYVAGSACLTCNFYQARGTTAAYGPCLLFPGKAVNAKGWCMSYVKAPK